MPPGQIAVTSAIVATLAFVPLALVAGIVGVLAFDLSPHALASFGGALPAPLGVLVCWLGLLVPSAIYVMLCCRT